MDGGSDVDHIHSLWPEDSQTVSVKRLQFLWQRMDSVIVIWPFYIFIKNQLKRHQLMLKLKLQYFGHLMQRVDSFEKTLMLEKTEGRRRRGRQRMRWLDDITDSKTWVWVNSEIVKDREAWHATFHGVAKSWTRLSNWTTTTTIHRSSECQILLIPFPYFGDGIFSLYSEAH